MEIQCKKEVIMNHEQIRNRKSNNTIESGTEGRKVLRVERKHKLR